MRKLLISFWPLLLFSCTLTSTNLQQARIHGPSNKSAIPITDSTVVDKTIVRSQVSINTGNEIRINTGTQTRIDIDNYSIQNGSPANYVYKEKNLTWQLPQFQVNLEAESTQKKFAETLGLNICQSNGSSFLGGHAGVAYFQNQDRWAWRLGFNLRFTSVKYRVNYI
ncbi:MAG: hypothetical protein ACE5I1_25180, partial [bacterium]